MNSKVLVKVILPEIDKSFDVFIPVNELMWKVKKILIKSVSDILNVVIDTEKKYVIINKDTCNFYSNNDLILNTDIRNGTELLLISQK